jgi:hypothetical protein
LGHWLIVGVWTQPAVALQLVAKVLTLPFEHSGPRSVHEVTVVVHEAVPLLAEHRSALVCCRKPLPPVLQLPPASQASSTVSTDWHEASAAPGSTQVGVRWTAPVLVQA